MCLEQGTKINVLDFLLHGENVLKLIVESCGNYIFHCLRAYETFSQATAPFYIPTHSA